MRNVVVFVVAGLAAGCGSLTEQPDMTFEMKTVLAESQPGCDSDTTACAKFEVNYPVLLGVDTMVQAAINERIVDILAAAPASPGQTIEGLGKDFIADFDAFQRENPEFGLGWYFDGNVSVLIASDTLISLQVDAESFTGGAHGSFTTRFVNVDPVTGTDYLLGALLRPGYEADIARLAEEDFVRQRMPADTAQTGLESPFKLNDNYGFRKEGVVFYFNDYELGSYAEGATEILIPYERLAAWMKK
jgi:hypothetical protein